VRDHYDEVLVITHGRRIAVRESCWALIVTGGTLSVSLGRRITVHHQPGDHGSPAAVRPCPAATGWVQKSAGNDRGSRHRNAIAAGQRRVLAAM